MKTANEHYEDGYTQGALEANDEIDRVKAQLDAMTKDKDEWHTAWLRLAAEELSTRKRLEAQRDALAAENAALKKELMEVRQLVHVAHKHLESTLALSWEHPTDDVDRVSVAHLQLTYALKGTP